MADSYTTQAFLCPHIPPRELMPQARVAATKAVSLDPTLAEAHASMGVIDLRYDWDTAGAEKHFQRAIALKPSYAIAHQWYGECLSAMARFDSAVIQLKIAQDLDPLSPIINSVLGGVLCFARQYNFAITQCRSTLEMHQGFWLALYFLGLAYEAQGEVQKAIATFEEAVKAVGNPMVLAALGHAYAGVGKRAEASALLDRLRSLAENSYTSPVNLALIAVGMKDYELAFAELDRAVEGRAGWLVFLRADPRFDCVRSDSRFEKILQHVFNSSRAGKSIAQ
jgi:tetratricopeptide (TPR) repeat protein